MRVFASDGAEFTAGQVQWMKGQLRLIATACADGNAPDASRRLAEVRQVLNEHHHESLSLPWRARPISWGALAQVQHGGRDRGRRSMNKDKQDYRFGDDVPNWLGFAAWWTLGATLLVLIWFLSAS